MDSKRVLVLAWSAADLAVAHPALDRGDMPHLRSLVESGSSGMLPSLAPLSVPVVATTLATGRHPDRHGVLAELEPRPDRGGVQPIGRRSWRAPSFWEILASNGFSTAVVNWPATAPADRWPGIVIGEEFAPATGRKFDDWPLPPHCVSPHSLRAAMADLRVHPREITTAELSVLVPRLAEIERRRDRRPARLAASLARTASVHAAATHLAEAAGWNMLLVRYTLIADLARDLALSAGESDPGDTTIYDGVIGAAYRLLDVMLGRLRALAGPETALVIAAPGGWKSAGLPEAEPSDPDTVASRDKGLLVAAGPGIRADAVLHGAGVTDLCPTILAYFGLSTASDGKVLTDLFAGEAPAAKPAVLPSAEAAPESLAPEDMADPAAHLIALGYRDQLNAAQVAAIDDAEVAALRNLADSCLARHEWESAITHLRALLSRVPDDYRATLKLGRVLLGVGDIEGARSCAVAALAAEPDLPWGSLLMGSLLALAGDTEAAEPHLHRARELGTRTSDVSLRLGWVSLMLRRWRDAEPSFRAVLDEDDTVAEAHAGLGLSLHGQGQLAEAESALRHAIGLFYHLPVAHFHLGQILAARGAYAAAADALRTALAQQPGLAEARTMLRLLEGRIASQIVDEALTRRD